MTRTRQQARNVVVPRTALALALPWVNLARSLHGQPNLTQQAFYERGRQTTPRKLTLLDMEFCRASGRIFEAACKADAPLHSRFKLMQQAKQAKDAHNAFGKLRF